MICQRIVRKHKSRYGYKIYASESLGLKHGGKRCGGQQHIEQDFEEEWGARNGWNGEGVYYSRFHGFVLKCQKCGDIVQRWNLDDLEQLVQASVQQRQSLPEYSRYRMN